MSTPYGGPRIGDRVVTDDSAGRVIEMAAREHVAGVVVALDGGGQVWRPLDAVQPANDPTPMCHLGHRCESCGAATTGLSVVVAEVLGASFCLTLCPGCAGSGRLPQIMLSTAQRLTEQHARHLDGYPTPGTL